MQFLKKSKLPLMVTTSLVGATILSVGFNAHAEVAASGHVSYNLVDRDSVPDPAFQRNGFTESRFRLIYKKELENGMKVELVEEIGLAEGEGALDARRQEVILKGGFGGVRFGQGNDAGDGNLNGDLSGTVVIQPLSSNAAAYGFSSANYNGFDPGRGERIRYDSPKLGGGAVISIQLGEKNEKEIGFRYRTKIGGGKLRIGAFATMPDTVVSSDSTGILIAYKFASGFNFALATGQKDNAAGAGLDGDFNAAKIGYSSGKHSVSLISGTSENPSNPVETDSTGIAYVYRMDKGIELFVASQEFDSTNNAVDEDFVVLGTRVKF